MATKYVLIDEDPGFVFASETREGSRVKYSPRMRTISNSLITAELILSQLNDGQKYAVLKEAVKAFLTGDPCENEKCATEGVCGECLGDLEAAYDDLEPS